MQSMSGSSSFFQFIPPELQVCVANKLNQKELNSLRTASKKMHENTNFSNMALQFERQQFFDSVGADKDGIDNIAIELQKFKESLEDKFRDKTLNEINELVPILVQQLAEECKRQEIQLINKCNFSREGEREKNDKARNLIRCLSKCKKVMINQAHLLSDCKDQEFTTVDDFEKSTVSLERKEWVFNQIFNDPDYASLLRDHHVVEYIAADYSSDFPILSTYLKSQHEAEVELLQKKMEVRTQKNADSMQRNSLIEQTLWADGNDQLKVIK